MKKYHVSPWEQKITFVVMGQKYGCPSEKDNNSTAIVIGKEHSECLATAQ